MNNNAIWYDSKEISHFCNFFSDDSCISEVLSVLKCLPENLNPSITTSGVSDEGTQKKKNTRKDWTEKVKLAMILQGIKGGNKCYSSQKLEKLVKESVDYYVERGELEAGSAGYFTEREWLYDLIWYKENEKEHYMITDLVLAMESEWDYNRKDAKVKGVPYAAVKYDFPKLVVSTARINVMIFRERKRFDQNSIGGYKKEDWKLELFDSYIEKQLRYAIGGCRWFLFVAYHTNMESFKFSLYRTSSPCW